MLYVASFNRPSMNENIRVVHGETPAELYKAVEGRAVLSFREIMAARVEIAMKRFRQDTIDLASLWPNFEEGVVLARSLKDSPLWKHRLTSSTHTIRTPEGYLTREWQMAPSFQEGIVDGGVSYASEFKATLAGRFMPEEDYDQNPGGCYPVEEWLQHRVLQDVVADEDLLKSYGAIMKILSHANLGSQGEVSIWCPQSLPVGHGRAWALGAAGDGAYPPNATTRHHWAAVHD